MTQWLTGMAVVLGALGGLLLALTLYRHAARPHPELLRKLLHVGMGLVTLSFPWLFDSNWPVLVLTGLSVALLLSLRLVSTLRAGLGQVVSGVARFSLGEIYFPLAVATLWVLYMRNGGYPPELRLLGYCVPVLLLTLSDALAALVGIAYGRLKYKTPDGTKSVEGSVAFFLCSFVCVHVPVLLMTDRGRAETLLIAMLLAWLATLFEAIAWSGLDNLILPVAAHVLLYTYWDMPVEQLLRRIWVMAALGAIVVAIHRRTPLRGSAILGAALLGYVCWALGGWRWVVLPLLLFLSSAALSFRYPANKDKMLNVHAVVSVMSGGLAWLFLSRLQNYPEWLYPYAVSFAAHLGIITLTRLRLANPTAAGPVLLVVCVAAGWMPMMALYGFVQDGTPRAVREAAAALIPVALAVAAFAALQPGMDDCPIDTPRWLRQATCAAAASVLAAIVIPFIP